MSSPALTPVKDKTKSNGSLVSTEIIPAKRPKTHDFLTYLCLRGKYYYNFDISHHLLIYFSILGAPILPTRLDFFSVSSVDSQNDDDFSNPPPMATKGPAKIQSNPKSVEKISEPTVL